MTEESAPNITHMQYDAMQTRLGLAPICRSHRSERAVPFSPALTCMHLPSLDKHIRPPVVTQRQRPDLQQQAPSASRIISHHPCSSSTRLMLDSSSFRLTSYKTRIVGSGRICGSTSCYLKLDQCRLGLLVVCDFLCNVVVNNLQHQTTTLLFFCQLYVLKKEI